MFDTIAALSTAPAKSGVAVIRISGPAALRFAENVFFPARRGESLSSSPRTMIFGALQRPDGQLLDKILAVYFRAPFSFNGEDIVEFHCHGSLAVINSALSALYALGARPALPGEFSKRAFLNGKLDLSQAEALGDLIAAETEEAAMNAAAQLDGALSREIGSVYSGLVDLLAGFQAVVDYPDEDITPFAAAAASEKLRAYAKRLKALSDGYERGRILKEGIPAAIIGKPNVGKSSLLNALCGSDRAIVTSLPGTTRDIVETYVKLGGVTLRLLDTAGLRDSGDEVERIGIDKAYSAAAGASLVFVVLDGSSALSEEDEYALRAAEGKQSILIINKSDLGCDLPDGVLARFSHVCRVSAVTGDGIGSISEAVAEIFCTEGLRYDGSLLTNARQAGACRAASNAAILAADALDGGYSPDMVLYDVEQAAEQLAFLLGKSTPEDIVERIFANFCVGK